MPQAIPLPDAHLPHPSDYRATEWFGRYRLWFDQVSPRIDDCAAWVAARPRSEADLEAAVDLLPSHQSWPLRIERDGERTWLVLEMLSDVCYLDMRNLRWALEWLAEHLEDAHFFVYSSGDALDAWIDEYRLQSTKLVATRHRRASAYMRFERLAFYRDERAHRDAVFQAFVDRVQELAEADQAGSPRAPRQPGSA